jgi:ubiquinol-cytochrome c reductase cytochrome c subunit
MVGRLFKRWLTRRARTPAWARLTLALVLTSVLLISIVSSSSGAGSSSRSAAGPSATATATPGPLKSLGGAPTTLPNAPLKSPEPQGAGAPTTSFPSSPELVAQGESLYENGCASCHGTLLQGISGNAPSLVGVGAGPVDFYLSSGRMPAADPLQEPHREPPAYSPAQIDALIAFITKIGGGPPAPAVDPAQGNLAVGFHVFTESCAGCHQLVGRGGLVVGAWVPNLQAASALQVAEAVRMGPYLMPHFDAKEINQYQLDSLVKYVLWTRHPSNYGGWALNNIGPIPEGMAAWFIGLLAMVLVARLIGERMTTE